MEKTLQEQLTEVETQLEQEKGKGPQKDADVITRLENQQAEILKQMDEEKAKSEQEAAQMVRIQTQEEKVATISLPYDFNDLYGDATANDSIIEVVQLFLREANDEHNKEIQALIDAHKEEIRAASEREVQLKRQNDELQSLLEGLATANEKMAQEHGQLILDKEDAEAKRDAAVRDKEAAEALLAEKQAHIETLRAEIAVGAKNAINVTNINPSDRLAALVEQSKNAKIKSAQDLALENDVPFRGKVEVLTPTVDQAFPFRSEVDQANVEPSANPAQVTIPAIPEVQPVTDLQFQPSVESHATEQTMGQDHTGDGGVSSASETVPGTTVTRQEHEALKARVDVLEKNLNTQAVA